MDIVSHCWDPTGERLTNCRSIMLNFVSSLDGGLECEFGFDTITHSICKFLICSDSHFFLILFRLLLLCMCSLIFRTPFIVSVVSGHVYAANALGKILVFSTKHGRVIKEFRCVRTARRFIGYV